MHLKEEENKLMKDKKNMHILLSIFLVSWVGLIKKDLELFW